MVRPEGSVDVCPVDKEGWDARAEAKKTDCGGESVYHCLSDIEGWKWEKCVQKTLISEGFCPIFTSDGYLDWKQCNNSEPSCPNRTYLSNEVYKYATCFGYNTAGEEFVKECDDSAFPVHILIIVIVLLLLLTCGAAILIIHLCRKRKNPVFEEDLVSFHPDGKDGKVKGVAKMFQVKDGVSTLLKEEVKSLVVKGKMGTSVFSTSSWILEECAKKLKWNFRRYRYTNLPNTVEDKTIILVYGWFGIWNDNLCSIDAVKTACSCLSKILVDNTKQVKIIFVMRKDLFNKYHDEVFERYSELFLNEICLDNTNTHKEYSTYLKKKVKGPCKNSDCKCKKLTTEIIRGKKDNFVGMPLKLNIISNHHDLISNFIDCKDILEAMANHIADLEQKTDMKIIYDWITYICLKGQFSRSEPFDEDLVKNLNLEISSSCFDENDSRFQRYFRLRYRDQQINVSTERARYVFWHPFIYICAFHALYNKDKEIVMTHCNVDAILELVRPIAHSVSNSCIEVVADKHCVNLFNKRMSQVGLRERYICHPLLMTPELQQS